MALLIEGGRPLHGIAILHGHPEGDVECLQQGFKMSDEEAKSIVERLVDGTLHSTMLVVDSREYLITNVSEFAMHGRCTDIKSGFGVVVVRTELLAIVGVY